MGLRFRVVLVTGLVAFGGLMGGVASGAPRPKTSISLQLASHNSFRGRLSSSKASCIRSRVVRLQIRRGSKWVVVATVKSNHSGRFQGTFHRRGAGAYRAVAAAKGRCATGTSKTLGAGSGSGTTAP